MPTGRPVVQAPAFTPRQFGLLSVAQDLTEPWDSHWPAGVVYDTYCADSEGTYDPCLVENIVIGDPEVITPSPEKPATFEHLIRSASPFMVQAGFKCSPPGTWEDGFEDIVRTSLVRSEERQVESAFWTGNVADNFQAVFPHLASGNPITDSDGHLLQTEAEVLGPETDIVSGIGAIEGALADCYDGQGVVHVPTRLLASMAEANLVESRGGVMRTALGTQVVVGAGYPGTSPDGEMTPGVLWIYGTGAVGFARSPTITFRVEESLDKSVNTVHAIAERVYVLIWDCCHFGIPIVQEGVS